MQGFWTVRAPGGPYAGPKVCNLPSLKGYQLENLANEKPTYQRVPAGKGT